MQSLLHRYSLGFHVKTKGFLSKHLYAGMGHIFCFHRVLPRDGRERIAANAGMEISPEKLEWIIGYFLDKKYMVISLDELFEVLSGRKKLSQKFIALTFDDGYNDNYLYAYPLLKNINAPFSVFVSTGLPENKVLMWWYFLENYLLENNQITWSTENTEQIYTANTLSEKESLYLKLRIDFIGKQEHEIKSILNEKMGLSDEYITEFCRKQALSWEQIRTMSDDPLVSIGAHTHSHRPLSKLTNEEASIEIFGSKKTIEEKTGKSVRHFAYPYGSSNEYGPREIKLAEKAGFCTSLTLQQGNVFKKHSAHLHVLPRIPLGEKADKITLNQIINGIRHFGFNGAKKII